jgi:hypothetical protein
MSQAVNDSLLPPERKERIMAESVYEVETYEYSRYWKSL